MMLKAGGNGIARENWARDGGREGKILGPGEGSRGCWSLLQGIIHGWCALYCVALEREKTRCFKEG